ncbi:MAG: hypothetical protein P9L97_05885 [Candidatus Tenebribacter davisii]|nr:hypothetical protein [Candidatus Tenebribacter davisii]
MKWYHYRVIETQESQDLDPWSSVKYSWRLIFHRIKIKKAFITTI